MVCLTWRGVIKTPMKETSPRKEAKQSRSKMTVNAILTATTQLLKDKGLKGLTTSGIIERAGVSVGSLYQYFPSKESILSVILKNQFSSNVDEFVSDLKSLNEKELTFDQAIEYLVNTVFDRFRVQSTIQKELMCSILTLNSLKFMLTNDEIVQEAVKTYISKYKDDIRDNIDFDRSSFLFQYMVKGLKFGVIFSNKEHMIDELKQDMIELMICHFKKRS